MSLKIVDLGGEPINFVSQFSDHPEQGIERDKVHVEEGGCACCGVGGVNSRTSTFACSAMRLPILSFASAMPLRVARFPMPRFQN